MRAPQTLEDIKKSPKLQPKREFGVSDFLTTEEMARLHKATQKSKQTQKLFDQVDSLVAEIIARFGYDVYLLWKAEEIDHDWMVRILNAERARDRQNLLSLELVVVKMISAQMSKKPQKGVRQAMDIVREDIRVARGES